VKKSENKKSFEENIARLEEIVALLEKGDAPLSDSLSLFQEGTGLVAVCNTMLSEAEQQVVKLQKGPEGVPVELPFAGEE
jgi:exodeoxyribonuclease VII small subunit